MIRSEKEQKAIAEIVNILGKFSLGDASLILSIVNTYINAEISANWVARAGETPK